MELPPLVTKYFGQHLHRLLIAIERGELRKPHFALAAYNPQELEERLKRVEPLNLTDEIVGEVGDTDNAILDTRLVNVWAEIRLLDQINSEHFSEIHKVIQTADFIATKEGKLYAFQVTRITSELSFQIGKLIKDAKNREKLASKSVKATEEIIGKAIERYFRRSLQSKNKDFQKWTQPNTTRCIVIVTSEQSLQDPLHRHITCRRLVKLFNSLNTRSFEEFIWLPDTGNGAWFRFDNQGNVHCFADWSDNPLNRFNNAQDNIQRRELDLESTTLRYLDS